jgi:hypothetical protein
MMAFACGGGGDVGRRRSGVDESAALLDLETGEIGDLCAYLGDVQSTAPSEVDCDGEPVTTGVGLDANQFAAGCEMGIPMIGPGCTATVGDIEDCFDDLVAQPDAEICEGEFPPSCDPLLPADCGLFGGP